MEGELEALRRELEQVQLAATAHKLSERNCVEIVQKLIEAGQIEVVYTLNGKEYLTHKQLRNEVKDELLTHGGRVGVVEASGVINVDAGHVEATARALAEGADDTWYLPNGELVRDYYLDTLAEEVHDALAEKGVMALGEVAANYAMPVEFVQTALTARLGKQLQAELRDGSLYTSDYVDRQRARVRGAFAAITRPTPVASVAAAHALDTGMLDGVVSALIAEGEVHGAVRGSSYVPHVFAATQRRSAEAFLRQNGYITKDRAAKLQISSDQLAAYLRTSFPTAVELPSCVVDGAVVDTLAATIEEAAASASWVDARPVVPSPLSDADVAQLIASCSCVGAEWQPGSGDGSSAAPSARRGKAPVAVHVGSSFVVSLAFMDQVYGRLQEEARADAEREKTTGAAGNGAGGSKRGRSSGAAASAGAGAAGADGDGGGGDTPAASGSNGTEEEEDDGFVVVAAPTKGKSKKKKGKAAGADAAAAADPPREADAGSQGSKGPGKLSAKARRKARQDAKLAELELGTGAASDSDSSDGGKRKGKGKRRAKAKKGGGAAAASAGGSGGSGGGGGGVGSDPGSSVADVDSARTLIAERLRQWYERDALCDEDEVVEAVAAAMCVAVAHMRASVRSEVFASVVHGEAAERRKRLTTLREELRQFAGLFYMYADGWQAFAHAVADKEDAAVVAGGAEKHLLVALAAPLCDLLIEYACLSAGTKAPARVASAASKASASLGAPQLPPAMYDGTVRQTGIAAVAESGVLARDEAKKTSAALAALAKASGLRGSVTDWPERFCEAAALCGLPVTRADVLKKADRKGLQSSVHKATAAALAEAAGGGAVLTLTLASVLGDVLGSPVLLPEEWSDREALLLAVGDKVSPEVHSKLRGYLTAVSNLNLDDGEGEGEAGGATVAGGDAGGDVDAGAGSGSAALPGAPVMTREVSAEHVTTLVDDIRSIGLARGKIR